MLHKATKTRIIEGNTYYFDSQHANRPEAERKRSEIQSSSLKAIVVDVMHSDDIWYAVYKRKVRGGGHRKAAIKRVTYDMNKKGAMLDKIRTLI